MLRFWRASAAVAAVLVAACAPTLPDYPSARETTWLDQGWNQQERDWYHHASQGTLTFGMPYEWFMALEKPDITIGNAGPFADPAYLDRFGFIPAATGLPVGFAEGGPFTDPTTGETRRNPQTGAALNGIGLTCAACHTGRMTYKGQAFLIDGGSAMTDLGKFRDALGLSLFLTDKLPLRFSRFADRVLGPEAGSGARAQLQKELSVLLTDGQKLVALDDSIKKDSTEEGFGRLDALNRIGNEVFALRLNEPRNYAPFKAPVHYPSIWQAPWFTWVQYDGSIMQPMVRNAGESLGVRALINLTNADRPLFAATVDIPNLHRMEGMLAGTPPQPGKAFSGLRTPSWPASMPAPDQILAAKGSALYQELCQGCHLPAANTAAFWTGPWWKTIGKSNVFYLDLHQIPIAEIGTDPAQAIGLMERTVIVPDSLGLGTNGFGLALGRLVEKTINRSYDTMTPSPSPAQRDAMSGGRPNLVQAKPEYKARLLAGIWASPPYLHNGSVPTVYDLLSPAAQRPAKFVLGHREYDPDRMGYVTGPLTGGFEVDTSLPGNSNKGHEFRDGPKGNGVIGRALQDDERRAIIAYLKTL
jgi:hypothetical protein